MRAILSQYALFLFTSMATAQDSRSLIIPASGSSTFPSCAVGCAALQQAQTNCQPQASTQLNFENCFCQEPTIAALYGTADALCVAECPTASDRTLLQTWYTSFCQQVGQGIDPLTAVPTTSTTMVTVTSTSAAANTPTATATRPIAADEGEEEGSWFSNHWQWVLMLIILAIGLSLLAWGATWWKKRHDRKLEQQRSSMSGFPTEAEKRRDGVRAATPDLWGPHQHMHATKGWEYHQDGATPSGSRSEKPRSRSKREHGPRDDALRDSAVGKPDMSRKMSKGKQRETLSIQEREPSRQRSRSHRRRDRDNG